MTSSHGSLDLRQLFDEHARYIWRALRHLGVADADIEDICQEVFLVAHRKLSEFQGRSSPRTWLYGIALRVASDYRRRGYIRRERAVADVSELVERRDDRTPEGESRQLLGKLLALLEADKREVLVLYELEGFTMKEVADMLGCPLQTAYSRLYSARQLLKDAVSAAGSGRP